jgi:tripartite-type tricarboxylate transporter receptor subunit TctC
MRCSRRLLVQLAVRSGQAVLLVALLAGAGSLRAEETYPAKPVTIVLPQPPGGAVDLIARTLAERLSEQLKQPFVVENKPGANGGLAAGQVARATPDGHTLFLAVDTNLCVNPNLYPNIGYDPFRDFAPISILVKLDLVLVAHAGVPFDDVQGMIAYAKANPGTLNYAAIGLGTQQHLGMELFKRMTGTDIAQINYRGTAPATTELLAGIVQVMFTGPQAANAHQNSGKLKVLAVAGPKRLALMPDVPTMQEAGVPGYELSGWFGLLAPARTPPTVVDRITRAVRIAVADPRFTDRLTAQGMEIVGSTPAEMLARMQADTAKWLDVIRATGARIQQ